jgi:hypothetical protein
VALLAVLGSISAQINAAGERPEPKRSWLERIKPWTDVLGGVARCSSLSHCSLRYPFLEQRLREATDGDGRAAPNNAGPLNAMTVGERAWIRVEGTIDQSFRIPIDFSLRANGVPFHALLTNTGKSPAFNVRVLALAFLPATDNDVVKAQEKACDRLKNQPLGGWENGNVLFPNQSIVDGEGTTTGGTFPGVAASMLEGLPKDKPNFAIYIVGCADYVSARDGAHRQTGFIYSVGRVPDGDERRRTFTFTKADSMPANELRLYNFGSDNGTN